MRVLFSSLFIVIFATQVFAGTPEEALRAYYSAFQQEGLDAYYEFVDTATMSEEELTHRREITRILWDRFDTVSYKLSDIRVQADEMSAIVRFHIDSEILGYDESVKAPPQKEIEEMPAAMRKLVLKYAGKKTADISEDLVAIMINDSDRWKVNSLIEQDQFSATMQALFMLDQPYQMPVIPPYPEKQKVAGGKQSTQQVSAKETDLASPIKRPVTVSLQDSKGIWLEAEEESSGNVAKENGGGEGALYTGFSGAGYWYLGTGGDWLMYMFEIRESGVFYVWLRDFNDGKHPVDQRTVEVLIDDQPVAEVPANNHSTNSGWSWHIAARTEIPSGKHIIMVRKKASNLAAAVIDALYLSPVVTDIPFGTR